LHIGWRNVFLVRVSNGKAQDSSFSQEKEAKRLLSFCGLTMRGRLCRRVG
jgi:hypothetical protein